jgi:hypothetical protein
LPAKRASTASSSQENFSQAIIWDKQHPVLTRKDYMGAHEWCFYGWREGAAHQFLGPANATDLWSIKKVNPQHMIHLTEKPVSTDPEFMQAGFGSRNARVPVLPANPANLKDARLVLWLHSTTTEAQDLVKLSKVPLAKALVHKYLETVFPELAAFSDSRSLDAVGPWLVISIGAPKAD